MALLNAANNLGQNLVEFTDFYNVSLDHMDLMSEYYTWQNPDRPGQFSYCQVKINISPQKNPYNPKKPQKIPKTTQNPKKSPNPLKTS